MTGLAVRPGLGDRGFGFPCMKQEGDSVSFGTSLTLKSFYNTTASYKISLNRALATTA